MQGRQVGEALSTLALLYLLALQIRMQKNNAVSALAKCKGNIFAYFLICDLISRQLFLFRKINPCNSPVQKSDSTESNLYDG